MRHFNNCGGYDTIQSCRCLPNLEGTSCQCVYVHYLLSQQKNLLLFLLRTANAFVYYGMSVNSTSLGGNKYLNFALVCLVEIPGYTLAWIAMNRFGRRRTLCGSLLLCTATCVAAVFVPQGAVFTVEQRAVGGRGSH
jgi:hypothetical protein